MAIEVDAVGVAARIAEHAARVHNRYGNDTDFGLKLATPVLVPTTAFYHGFQPSEQDLRANTFYAVNTCGNE